MHSSAPPRLLLVRLVWCFWSLNVAMAAGGKSPFTPKSYLMRYWDKHISNNLPKPSFLLDKASPLTAEQFAVYSKLAADQNSLSTHLPDFCTKAHLFCFPDPSPSLEKHGDDVDFTNYENKNFTNYGGSHLGGADTFKNYSDDGNVISDNFRRYGRDSAAHDGDFTSYARAGNVADESFTGYGAASTGGVENFTSYNSETNVPNLRFASYSDESNGRNQKFAAYTGDANSGDETFISYGKNGNGAGNEFSGYGENSNTVGSNFRNYGETGNGGKDNFTSYGGETNDPHNNFKNYAAGGNGAVDSFKSYRNYSNVGDDDFKSYAKKSNAVEMDFENYGQSLNIGTTKFSGYGEDASGQKVDFKVYGVNSTFKAYAKEGVTFSSYTNESSSSMMHSLVTKGKKVNKWVVEPGKFFRESMLRSGVVMPMPDIRDKMPKRSFLPRSIVAKLPFSSSKIDDLKTIFHAGNGSSMGNMLVSSLQECEREPSPGETKQCVASVEDMIDFAVSVLGQNVTVRTTENTRGYNGNITIGQVKRIHSGNVTRSVSCHQSLFPYLLYYCHSVPKVRVHEADILDPESKAKINHGVAICHLDTSAWSPQHGAFISLGSGPGRIEVCHWIFENDMVWTVIG